MTNAAKGVAIIFMIFLHVFGGPNWYESSYNIPLNSNTALLKFMGSLQICVGIYAFMIGFGYAFSKTKDLKYSLLHVKKLLTVFWAILLLLIIPAGYSSIHSAENFIYELFGIKENLCWVSWFIYLYIWSMVVLPFASRFLKKQVYIRGIAMIAASYAAMVLIWLMNRQFAESPLFLALMGSLGWTPTIILGYIFSKERLFQRIHIPASRWVYILAIVIIFATLFCKSIFNGILIVKFDLIYAPLVLGAIIVLLTPLKTRNLKYKETADHIKSWRTSHKIVNQAIGGGNDLTCRILRYLGQLSVYMWFIHSIFFSSATRPTYQKFIMISDNLWIIAIWTVIISMLISIPFKKIIELK